MEKRPSSLSVVAAFAAVYVIWGSTYLGIKFAIETLPPFLMSGWRFLIAGGLLIAWALASGSDRPTRAHWFSAGIVGALLFLCGNGGVVWAEQYIPSGLAALLVATEPLWIVLLNWVRPDGARPGVKVVLGLIAGFAGVWLLIGSRADGSGGAAAAAGGGEGALIGASVVIAAAFAWAVGSIYSLQAKFPASPLLTAGMQMLVGGALLTLAGTFSGEWASLDSSRVSALSIGAFLYLIVFGSIVAFTAYSWLLRAVSPARASTYAYVNPAVAVLLGWALADEAISFRTLIAAAIIVASVMLIVSHGTPNKTAADENARRDEREPSLSGTVKESY